MSVDFWESSQRQVMEEYAQLTATATSPKRQTHAARRDKGCLTKDEIEVITMWLAQKIFKCAQLSKTKLRSRVAATAVTYMKRFYIKNAFVDFNPLAVAPACILLASKVEECLEWPGQILESWRQTVGTKDKRWGDTKEAIIEAEVDLLLSLGGSLLVHHPYRPLELFLKDATAEQQCLGNAWSLVNDSFIFDVGLTYPPHIIALACMHMASVMVEKDLQQWYLNITANSTQIFQVMEEMLRGYDMMGRDNGEFIKRTSASAMEKIVKAHHVKTAAATQVGNSTTAGNK